MRLHALLSRTSVCRVAGALSKLKPSACHVSAMSSERYPVIHDKLHRRFTVRLDDGGEVQCAVLRYSRGRDGHVHLASTEVPESFKGKGVAASLAKAALDFVVEERLKASISCWYIKKYVDENPHNGYKVHIED